MKLDRFFKDPKGKAVIWQAPNIPLYGWIAFKIFAMFLNGPAKSKLDHLSTAFLFTWAFLEATKGVNYFRRLLGLVVLIAIIISF